MIWRISRRSFCGETPIIAPSRWPSQRDGFLSSAKEGWPGTGACARSFDPGSDPIASPAIWDEASAAAVVTLSAAPPHLAVAGRSLAAFAATSAHEDGDCRHLVIDADGIRYRLLLWRTAVSDRLAVLLPATADPARIVAADAVRALLAGAPPPRLSPVLAPTVFQRRRLVLLLAVLDAHRAGETGRAIGTSIVAPRLAGISAAAWKASGERRRVQRLIGEALGLMHGGYRALLSGAAGPPR
jgi:hypothetical protein